MPRATNSPTIVSGNHRLAAASLLMKVSSITGSISRVNPAAAAASINMPMPAIASNDRYGRAKRINRR